MQVFAGGIVGGLPLGVQEVIAGCEAFHREHDGVRGRDQKCDREIRCLTLAERLIESCEHCKEEGAQIPFDNILDHVTGPDPSLTDYIFEEPAKCPNCRRKVLEKTLIEPA